MEAQIERLSAFEVRSVQHSGETQYAHFSVRVPASGGLIEVHLGFRRSTDLDEADKAGQDYAVARGEDGYVVGVVADGVSQSFYGNLAACFVSEHLLKYLWESRGSPPSEAEAEEMLLDLQDAFREEVERFELPENLPSLLRQALETTRRMDGSQAVISAFVLNGLEGTCHLYQVGDAVALVRQGVDGGGVEAVGADPKGRWSSTGRTKLRLRVTVVKGIDGVLVKSDGAKDWGSTLAADEVNEESFRGVVAELADYDDVSFVAALLGPGSDGGRPAEEETIAAHALRDAHATPGEDDDDTFDMAEPEPHEVTPVEGVEESSPVEEVKESRPVERVEGRGPSPGDSSRLGREHVNAFAAGLLTGVSLMLFLYFYLAWAGMIRRVFVCAVVYGRAQGH